MIAIGTLRTELPARLDAAADPSVATPTLRVGISPHTPYTVEPAALQTCARRAAQTNLPLSIHLAESADEEAAPCGEGDEDPCE